MEAPCPNEPRRRTTTWRTTRMDAPQVRALAGPTSIRNLYAPLPYLRPKETTPGRERVNGRPPGRSLVPTERLFPLGPGLDHLDESRGIVDVLLAAPFAVPRVLQDRYV